MATRRAEAMKDIVARLKTEGPPHGNISMLGFSG
jgi:hypothetical protein